MALHDPARADVAGMALREGANATTTQFSIGICATGQPPTLAELIDTIETERFPQDFSLMKIIVVASACAQATLRHLERVERTDPKVVLIREEERRGKVTAINRIIKETVGDYLVLVNADAVPSAGAISRLLKSITRHKDVGMVSGTPVIATRAGRAPRVLELMWGTHNTCARDLNLTALSNHGTDELMVVRYGALEELPAQVVNDGAYIAGRLRMSGFRVRSLEGASVRVDVPSRPVEIIRQRRRILYGHLQVWRLVGKVPATAESLMVVSPERGFGAVVRTVAKNPRLIPALPVAAVYEFISLVGAIFDSSAKEGKHTVWKRYAS